MRSIVKPKMITPNCIKESHFELSFSTIGGNVDITKIFIENIIQQSKSKTKRNCGNSGPMENDIKLSIL